MRFSLDAGHHVVYVDPRRFGTGHLLHGEAARDEYLAARLGIEPFTPRVHGRAPRERSRAGRRAPVKAFLLDQRRIAGVGNIYADEALFRAGIHPLRPAGRLTAAELARLRDAIEEALAAGIEAKGASIDDFRHIDGARGSFQDRFLVHRRAGEPCPRCGTVDPQDRRRRPGNVRVRALPAQAARHAPPRFRLPEVPLELSRRYAASSAGQTPRAVGGEQLGEPADRLVTDHDLRET